MKRLDAIERELNPRPAEELAKVIYATGRTEEDLDEEVRQLRAGGFQGTIVFSERFEDPVIMNPDAQPPKRDDPKEVDS